jgi:hypothetical protein
VASAIIHSSDEEKGDKDEKENFEADRGTRSFICENTQYKKQMTHHGTFNVWFVNKCSHLAAAAS